MHTVARRTGSRLRDKSPQPRKANDRNDLSPVNPNTSFTTAKPINLAIIPSLPIAQFTSNPLECRTIHPNHFPPKKHAPTFTITIPSAHQADQRSIRASKPPIFVRRDSYRSNCTRGAAPWHKYSYKEHCGSRSLRSQRCTRANDVKSR